MCDSVRWRLLTAPSSKLVALAIHDSISHRLLVTGMSSAGLVSVEVTLANDEVNILESAPTWPGTLSGVASVNHPPLGTLFIGGHDPSGYTAYTWSTVAQACP